MLRAGLIRQLAAGIYVFLPLGQRVLDKVNAIIREEMNAIGGQGNTLPGVQPPQLWEEAGRRGAPGGGGFRLQDPNRRRQWLGLAAQEVGGRAPRRGSPS